MRTIFFFVDQLIGFKGSSAASRPGGRAGLAPAEGGAGSGSSAAASVPKPPRSCFSTSSTTVAGAFSYVVARDEVESLMRAGWAKRRPADSGGEQEREQGWGSRTSRALLLALLLELYCMDCRLAILSKLSSRASGRARRGREGSRFR